MNNLFKYSWLLILSICSSYTVSAQLSGKVLNEKGEALPYATVYVRNTSNGTVANAAGFYQLNVPEGNHEVVFQYIGYNTKVEEITISGKAVTLNAKLEPSDLQLKEVVISSKDPAERIMREVIAKRSYYKNKVDKYACDVYIKGFYKLIDAPKKILGQEVGNMGGILDTNRNGVLYLSESVSKVYFKSPPEQKKEIMISSRVSGNDNGYSLNRATLTDFDLYSERINIEREILSPLADNAFGYYKFKWLGSYKDLNGYTIEKIQVTPKRESDPAFSGYLYVVDSWWNLAGVDLSLTGTAIKQPVLDTMRVQQQFVMLQKPDTWRLLTQVTSFKFGILGIKVSGFFNGIFSNYDLNPSYEAGFFNNELFEIEKKAGEFDSIYWNNTRPIPLTVEEQNDYVKKDSLQKIWKSKEFLDSIDRRQNRFEFNNLLFGYTWSNTYKHRHISYPAVFSWVQFNTVQGLVLDFEPELEWNSDERGSDYWRINGNLNYGFSEKILRGGLKFKRLFESIHYRALEVSGGRHTPQFNELEPVNILLNTSYSLFSERNYLKIYDKSFGNVTWSQVLAPGISMTAFGEYAHRSPLINHTSYSWRKGDESRYTPNAPIPELDGQDAFKTPDIFMLGLDLRFRIGQQYSTYPDYRIYTDSKWPDITIRYRKAIAGVLGSDADYDFVHLLIRQQNLNWGLGGYSEWSAGAGLFLQKNAYSFMDLYHPSGNLTNFGSPTRYSRSFLLLPYYAYATDQPFVEAHAQHHLQGWLLDKLPLLRKLNWKEVIGGSIFYAEQESRDPAYTGKLPYWELNAGFENIGIKAIRPLRIDFAWSFFGNEFHRFGFLIGVSL
ncbi:MAG: DUF5686 and carboxypeptidase regulatory-like domain-containing protein [Saprospiraceae bacterium]|nr:carboxypeptidase-like regulatory domain-containing protein [Saprospiraceae bacterium]